MKRSIAFVFLCLLALTGFGQEKMFSMADASGLNRDLFPQRLRNLSWVGPTNEFSYIENECLIRSKINQDKRDSLLRLTDLNQVLAAQSIKELKRFPTIKWVSHQDFIFHHDKSLFSYRITEHTIAKKADYPEKAERFDFHEATGALAYTLENNLCIILNGKTHQITQDLDTGIINGREVHRNEFGIEKGTFWSPAGNKLAFYRMDESMVAEYPLVHVDSRIARLENIRYPMAGEASHEVSLGIYDLSSEKTVFLNIPGPKDQYLCCVSWAPDGSSIFVAVLNRDQNHLALHQYDPISGAFIKTLFEEKDLKYVEPLNPLHFIPGRNDQFIWFSERDGYNHMYLYSTKGELIRQLTVGKWVVKDFLGFSNDGKTAWYTSTAQSPLETQVYALELKNGRSVKLSYAPGTHGGLFSGDGKYFIDIYSNAQVSSETLILDNKGNLIQVLVENKDPLENYSLGETQLLVLKAEDGSDLHGRLILPPHMDVKKKYPVFIYVYGGPHAQLITNSWLAGAGLFLNYMAQQGYIVFTLDNRGSANRGKDFEQAIFRKLGELEVKDQMVGVEYLKTLPYVDTGRIGVNGWSYGGFMAISMMLRHPDVFKVGCAGGPVIDWKYYEVMYGERYMDTPQNNPDGYTASSLLDKVDSLEGHLLIIHGTMDGTVVWQHSLDFIKKCIDKGKQVDYFVYPGHEHNVRGKDRAHLNKKIADYFQAWL